MQTVTGTVPDFVVIDVNPRGSFFFPSLLPLLSIPSSSVPPSPSRVLLLLLYSPSPPPPPHASSGPRLPCLGGLSFTSDLSYLHLPLRLGGPLIHSRSHIKFYFSSATVLLHVVFRRGEVKPSRVCSTTHVTVVHPWFPPGRMGGGTPPVYVEWYRSAGLSPSMVYRDPRTSTSVTGGHTVEHTFTYILVLCTLSFRPGFPSTCHRGCK